MKTTSTSSYFNVLCENISGYHDEIQTPYGSFRNVYFDWTATGRGFLPIEKLMIEIGAHAGNPHTESNYTGKHSTVSYEKALLTIKKHVGADESDVVLGVGSGATAAINKLHRLLGIRYPEQLMPFIDLPDNKRPVTFVTNMEHHSNHTSWLETISDVVVLEPNENGDVDAKQLEIALEPYREREVKIGSFTACSNVTGIETPYHELAKVMHEHNGYCFIDFAASAPYVPINMHPENPEERLDAIFFSPHKMLGGQRTCGILVFNKSLCKNSIPDHPGGGTVLYTTPWEGRKYFEEIQVREDGGTPPFLQIIQVSQCLRLKEQMLENRMQERKEMLLRHMWSGLSEMEGVTILERNKSKRQGIISFYAVNIHHSLLAKLLNDRYGIQVRPGCSCAGTYGHYLLKIGPKESKYITNDLDNGQLASKPGWVRASLHPTNTIEEIDFFLSALQAIIQNFEIWKKEYVYCQTSNEYKHITESDIAAPSTLSWEKYMIKPSVNIN
ncbi:selenocysteine lyase [Priestia megaterium]|nr:selenocysteine lyase [Priestia megaterium]